MDLTHLGRRLLVTDYRIIDKAKEYARLAKCKQGVTNSKQQQWVRQRHKKQYSVEAQSVACIDLACKLYSQSVDSSLLVKYSLCRTPAAYAKVLSGVQATLGLTSVVSTKELAIQYGCIQANDLARKVLKAYKEKMREAYQQNTPTSASASASSSSSFAPLDPRVVTASSLLDSRNVYPCVAFYLSCKHLNIVGVDRKRLLATAAVKDKEFNHVMESFCAVIPELTPTKSPTKKPKTTKPKDDTPADEQGDHVDDSGELKEQRGKRKRAGRPKKNHDDDGDDDGNHDADEVDEDDFNEDFGENDDGDNDANEESQQRKKPKNSDAVESDSDLAAASSFLKQAKLNFNCDKQLRVVEENDGEAQLSN